MSDSELVEDNNQISVLRSAKVRLMMLLSFLLGGLWWGQVRAWYNTSGLAGCQHHNQDWSDLAKHIENNQVRSL